MTFVSVLLLSVLFGFLVFPASAEQELIFFQGFEEQLIECEPDDIFLESQIDVYNLQETDG
jgi:hypothetical protein